MAGDWLPIRLDLSDDPAILSIAHTLDLPIATAVGATVMVWCWGQRHLSANGHADVTPMSALDSVTSVPGFAKAMETAGWLERNGANGESFTLPNWDLWNSQSAKKRLTDTRRRQKNRAGQERDKSGTTEEKRTVQKSTSKKEPPIVPHSKLAEKIQAEWNHLAKQVGLPLLRKPPGKKGLAQWKLRMSELSDEFWAMVLDECRHLNDFALGKNDRGWKLDFSYVVTATGAEKLRVGGWRKEEGRHGLSPPKKGSAMAAIQEWDEMRTEMERRGTQ